MAQHFESWGSCVFSNVANIGSCYLDRGRDNPCDRAPIWCLPIGGGAVTAPIQVEFSPNIFSSKLVISV